MKLNLITRDTIKAQLGLTGDATYDSDIDATIPIVSNDIRRILNCNFDEYRTATITNGSNQMTSWEGPNDSAHYYYNRSDFMMGQVIYSPAIPDDTYITTYDRDTGIYTLSNSATADGDYFYKTLTIGQWNAVSKMVFYRISKLTTTDVNNQQLVQISYGNVSKTFSEKEINKRFDYPQVLIDDLGKPFAKTG